MGEVDRERVLATLLKNGNRRDVARLYCDAYCEYFESMGNIEKNGSVCANPRTGAPMDNPYLKVRDRARVQLARMKDVKTKGLW